MSDWADRLSGYIVQAVESRSPFIAVDEPDVLVDRPDRVRVQIDFGLDDRAEQFKHSKPVLFKGQRCRILIDETRAAGDGLGELIAYEYELIDAPYGYELAFHEHHEPGIPRDVHQHLRELGGKRHRIPDRSRVALEDAISAFVAAMWANRSPEPPVR